ncbi:hypothetical protein NKH77_06370 [Streptomyces sp. M19]
MAGQPAGARPAVARDRAGAAAAVAGAPAGTGVRARPGHHALRHRPTAADQDSGGRHQRGVPPGGSRPADAGA